MNWNEWREGIHQLTEALINFDEGQKDPSQPLLRSHTPEAVQATLASNLPEQGQALDQVIEGLVAELLPHANYNPNPNYAAYITGSGNKAAALAELAKSFLNQNGLKWNSSPIAAELERLVLQWIAEFLNLPHHAEGFLTSCGSTANYYALHFALARAVPDFQTQGLRQAPPLAIYQSDQTHSSVVRAAYFLGLGTEALRTIPTGADHRMDLRALESQLEADRQAGIIPLALVANAGSTNTGVVDDLQGMAKLAQHYGAWYHVDGAYGLPARGVAEFASFFAGAELADSVTINPHKWLYVPFEVSTVLLREAPPVFQGTPSYLKDLTAVQRHDLSTATIELSKEFRALKVWFTFRYYGAERLREAIRHDVALIQHVAHRLEASQEFEVLGPHPLSILCFRLALPEFMPQEEKNRRNQAFLAHLQAEGHLFMIGTEIFGKYCLRLCFVSLTRTEADANGMVDYLQKEARIFLDRL